MSKYYNAEGWADNVSNFTSKSASGITEPAFEDMGNGLYAHKFTDGEALVIKHHINHDVMPNGETYFHIHWAPSTSMAVGETIEWEVIYVVAKGHHQGDTFEVSPSTITLTYTADGTEIQGEHMVLECNTPIVTPEPDSFIVSKVTYGDGTYGKACYGFTMDLHYQVDRNSTPNKAPDFYV